MILEHAVLDVRPGEREAFEAAFRGATALIAATPGFGGLELRRCLETDGRYLLLVQWDRLEDHTEGFRGSSRYEEWRAQLHHFYEPFPTVDHYEGIVAVPRPE
jgi:heme-degrading monooxygenase HmoA